MKKLTIDNNFSDRLKTLLQDKIKIKQTDFCKRVGITQGYFSMILSGKRGPSADLIAGLYLNYSEYLTWLLTGEEKKEPTTSENITKLIIEHQDLLKRFKNQKRAKEINERLIDIEDASDELYDKADTYLQGLHDAAKVIKGSKKTPNEREDLPDNKASSD